MHSAFTLHSRKSSYELLSVSELKAKFDLIWWELISSPTAIEETYRMSSTEQYKDTVAQEVRDAGPKV